MSIEFLVLSAFFLATLAAAAAGGKNASSESEFYLAGRRLRGVSFIVSLAATNFSAFTVLGLAGAGYRIGYAFYPAMGLGTGFMAIGLYLAAKPMGELGRVRGWVTPTDLVAERYGSPALAKAYALCLIAYTLPYLSLQPMAAGYLLESAFGMPYRAGVVSIAALIALYTVGGGLRAVVRTDLLHGAVLAALVPALWLLASWELGGVGAAQRIAAEKSPFLFSRPGGAAGISVGSLAGYFVLWFLADPLFPQLGQRFLAVRSDRTLERTVVCYPIVTTALFFFTISTGIIASALIPGLSGGGADRAWPLLAARGGPLIASILILGPLTALMTTMDSQLLTLSSLFLRDIAGKRDARGGAHRATVLAVALIGTALALAPPEDILGYLNRTSFLGFAALSPLVFGGLYLRGPGSRTAALSLIAGQSTVVGLGLGLIRAPGIPDVFLAAGAAWMPFALAAVRKGRQAMLPAESFEPYRLGDVLPARWAVIFVALLLPAFDFWNWGKRAPALVAGLPVWVWISIAQGILLSLALAAFFRSKKPRRTS